MDPFAPGRSYSRRNSSGHLDPRHTPGHPLYAPAESGSRGYPFVFPPLGGEGRPRLPSPGDALRGPDRFEYSLELPPLLNIPRSSSPILGRSSNRGNLPDLPPLPSLGSGLGSSLGPGGRYTGSSTADALIDPFTAPAPRLRRRASRTGGFGMDTEEPVQHGSMTSRRPGSGGMQSSSSLGPLPSLSELPTFSTSSSLASSSLGGALSSPSGDNYPSIGGEGELGPSHASRHLRKPARRATFSQAQLNIMEDLWSQTEYPSNDQIEACASATGLSSKQVRTWFGNTRQARLAGTRREARHAPIPGQPGTGTANRRGRGELPSMYASGLGRPLLGSLGTDSGLPPMPSLFGGISFTPGGGLGPLPSIASYYGPTAADPRSSGGRGALFPHLDPLPESRGGTGGLLPGFGPGERSGLGGLQGGTSQRTRRRSIGSYPSMNFGQSLPPSSDYDLPPPSKKY